MAIKLFKDKKARFVDFTRSLTVGNFFFFVVMFLIILYFASYFSNQIFGTKIINIGTPFKLLLIAAGLIVTFYVIVRRQGTFDRSDVFVLILVILGLTALFYYAPKILPEIFNNGVFANTVLTSQHSPFPWLYNTSVDVHNTIQTVVPIP